MTVDLDVEATEDEAVDAEWEAPPTELAPDVEHAHADLDDREVVVSAFAGIGGIDLGLERAGYQTGVQIEWDAAASRVLAARFPRAARYGDVRHVDGDAVRRSIGGRPVKILGGGFPCQDLSVAGRRAGMAGERSGLYGELLRLASQLDPDWLVVENVPGLLSADVDPEANDGAGYGAGSGFALFLGDLTGYQPPVPDKGWRNSGVCHGPLGTAAWRVLDARHFGVAQRRRRVFVVFHPRDRRAPAAVLLEPEGVRWDPAARRPSWAGAADAAVGTPVRGGAERVDGAGADGAGSAGDMSPTWTPDVSVPLGSLSGGQRQDLEGMTYVPVATNALDGDVARALVAEGASDPHDYSQSTYVAVEEAEAQGFHEYPDGKFGLEDYAPPPIVNTSAKILDPNAGRDAQAFTENRPGEVYLHEEDEAGSLTSGGGKPGQGYQAIIDGRPVGHIEAAGGEDLAPTVTSKWAKGRGGPAGSETGNLVTTGVDTYNQAETGEVAHSVRANAGPEGVPAVTVVGDDVIGFDTLNTEPTGDEVGTLRAGSKGSAGHAQVVVVGDGGSDVSHPVTASGTDGMGRGVPAVAYGVAMRGRDEGNVPELTEEAVSALRAASGGSTRDLVLPAESVTGRVTHALTAEGSDASEDGTGRGTPIIPYAPEVAPTLHGIEHGTNAAFNDNALVATPEVAAPLTAGSHTPGVSAPGRRQEDDVNLVAYRKARNAQTSKEIIVELPALCSANVGGDPVNGCEEVALPGTDYCAAHMEVQGGSNQDQFIGPGGTSPTLVGGGNTHAGHHQPKVVLPADDPRGGAVGVHITQEPIHGEEFAPALGAKSTGQGVAQTHAAVRRLTPRECERLQGFPDDWTLVPDGKGKAATDSPRYKQLGNAVCVNVPEWLGCRIHAYDHGLLG